jgi:hypothetical protein
MNLHSMVLDLGQILCCKKNHFDSNKKFSKTDNIKMLEVLIDNICADLCFTSTLAVFQLYRGVNKLYSLT